MSYNQRSNAVLLLQDGTVFYGKSVIDGTVTGELCFNTGTTGYQEIFTDPSYFGQIMVTTNAHIGNYGVREDDRESDSIKISGLICKNFSEHQSRPSSEETLYEFFQRNDKPLFADFDTRAIVSYVREHGAMNAVVSSETDLPKLQQRLETIPSMAGLELASKVSTKEPYHIGHENAEIRIAVLDLGVKQNILRNLASRGCYLKVFPYNSSFEELRSFEPHGYFISNGPGDPQPLTEAIATAKEILQNNLPLFGICLGHQVIALASGIETYKMYNGHRGINHPVINKLTGKGEITSQNHGFAVSAEQLEKHPDVELTHTHLNDQSVAGLRYISKPCFSVQYHPEAGPGPNDATYLFDQFIDLIKQNK